MLEAGILLLVDFPDWGDFAISLLMLNFRKKRKWNSVFEVVLEEITQIMLTIHCISLSDENSREFKEAVCGCAGSVEMIRARLTISLISTTVLLEKYCRHSINCRQLDTSL